MNLSVGDLEGHGSVSQSEGLALTALGFSFHRATRLSPEALCPSTQSLLGKHSLVCSKLLVSFGHSQFSSKHLFPTHPRCETDGFINHPFIAHQSSLLEAEERSPVQVFLWKLNTMTLHTCLTAGASYSVRELPRLLMAQPGFPWSFPFLIFLLPLLCMSGEPF